MGVHGVKLVIIAGGFAARSRLLIGSRLTKSTSDTSETFSMHVSTEPAVYTDERVMKGTFNSLWIGVIIF